MNSSIQVTFLLTLLTNFILFTSLTNAQHTAYYEKLNIQNSATTKEIRKAFKQVAKKLHPDKNKNDPKAEEKFREITDIYEILKDDETRKIYDRYGEEGIKDHREGKQAGGGRGQRRTWQFYQNEGLYDDDDEIHQFENNEFDFVEKGDDIYFVNFYSTMCSHCHTLAPTWRILAKQMLGTVNIAAVNCMDQRYLCQRMSLSGYPSLILYSRGGRQKYQGSRSLEHITEWLMMRLQPSILKVNQMETVKALMRSTAKSTNFLINVCTYGSDCIENEAEQKLAAATNKYLLFYSLDCELMEIDCESYFGFNSGIYARSNQNDETVKIDSKEVLDLHSIVKILLPKILPKLKSLETGPVIKVEGHRLRVAVTTYGMSPEVMKGDANILELRKLENFLEKDNNFEVVHVDCSQNSEFHQECQRFHHFRPGRIQIIFSKHGEYNLYWRGF